MRAGPSSATAGPYHQKDGIVPLGPGARGFDEQVSVQAAGSEPSRTGPGFCHEEAVDRSTRSEGVEMNKSTITATMAEPTPSPEDAQVLRPRRRLH